MKKFLLTLLVLLSLGFVASAEEKSWSVTFKTGANNNQAEWKTNSDMDNVCSDGAANFAGIKSVSKVSPGLYGLKIGQNKNTGNITFSIAENAQVLPSKIEVEASANKNANKLTFKVNNISKSLSSTATNNSYDTIVLTDFTSTLTEITLEGGGSNSNQGFVYVNKITVYYSEEGGETPVPTECPEPVFSVADGANVYPGSTISVDKKGATSVELYANNELVEGTEYTVPEDAQIGSTITLKAKSTLTIEEGDDLTAENEITITVIERPAMYDFTSAPAYGMDVKSGSSAADFESGEKIISTHDIVTLTLNGSYRLVGNVTMGSEIVTGLRLHANQNNAGVGKMTIAVPKEYYIEEVDFGVGSTSSNASVLNGAGSLANNKWTFENQQLSEISLQRGSSNPTFTTITVKYALRPATIKGLRCEVDRVFKNTAYFNYMLHVDNHYGDESGSEYTVVLTVNGEDFPGEHSLMNPASAPRRELSENDVPSTHTFVGKVGAQGLEGLTPYTATLRVEHNGNVVEEHTINDIQFETTNTTGIEDVTVDGNEAAEYFNLQGVRVAQPEAGQIYIVRRGAKVVKELVK